MNNRFKAVVILLFLCLPRPVFSQIKADSLSLRLMFYNVENLFDTKDDSLSDDIEYLPGGLMRWNISRYKTKLNDISKVIIAAGAWNPPAVVGLCEIENKDVLGDLVYGTPLSAFGYGIIHEESPDPRGIDVAMIYRRDIVSVIDHCLLIPENAMGEEFHSRGVLYARCLVYGDTLHMLFNHWPSRRGGVLAAEGMRERVAMMLKNSVDSICKVSKGEARILVLGDFNCTPSDQVMSGLTSHGMADGCTLVNLTDHKMAEPAGTYRYQGTWEKIDQVIVSDNMLNRRDGVTTRPENFRIFSPDFLLKDDQKFPGRLPFSTYRGYSYQGGFSDHLPVLLDLEFH